MVGVPTSALEVLAQAGQQRIGRYEYHPRENRWWWSDMFYEILGFQPGEVVASPSVLAAHLRPDGSFRGIETVESAFSTGDPFSFLTRVVNARGAERTVLLAGHGEAPAGSRDVELVTGYLIDLTEARRRASEIDVHNALAGALEFRAVIEQSKGVLMLAHAIDSDEAFDLLRTYSQDNNVKVRDVAARLVELVAKDGKPYDDFLLKVLQIFDVD